MKCTEHAPDATCGRLEGAAKGARESRKGSVRVARAVLAAFVPNGMEARRMLEQLQRETLMPRRFVAAILGVSEHVLRRWLDGSRLPNQAARRLIAVVCESIAGLSALEIADVLAERALSIGEDSSQPVGERVACLRLVAELGTFRAKLGEATLAKIQTSQ